MTDFKVEYIDRGAQLPRLAYIKTTGDASKPTIIHAHGLCNNMQMNKPRKIHEFCQSRNYSFVRFDLTDHGESQPVRRPGEDKHAGMLLSFEQWRQDLRTILDKVVGTGPIVLFGDSVGFWLCLLAALDNHDRVKGMCGFSAGVDFWERWHQSFFVSNEKVKLDRGEVVWLDGPYGEYVGKLKLEKECSKYKMLTRMKVPLKCPFRFVHRQGDVVIPVDYIVQLLKKLESKDAQLHIIKGGDHRMIFEEDDKQIIKGIEALFEAMEQAD